MNPWVLEKASRDFSLPKKFLRDIIKLMNSGVENYQNEFPKFKNPEEEINFLHKEIQKKEKALAESGKEFSREEVVSENIKNYEQKKPEEVLDDSYRMKESEAGQIVLELKPEEHDEQINELLEVVLEKGIKNALLVASSMENPHIYDDFHRFLVQFVKAGYEVEGLDKDKELFKKLHTTLYEITLPGGLGKDGEGKSFKELVSAMEQFYAGMISVADEGANRAGSYFSLEIALSNQSDEVVFYASVPDSKKDLFEKQLSSSFPDAKTIEYKDDYNIFNEEGESAGAVARSTFSPALSLKTYDKFDNDPLNIILNVFSKMKRDGEGASIQIVLSPAGDYYVNRYRYILDKLREGVPLRKAIKMPENFTQGFGKAFKELALGAEKPKRDSGGLALPTQVDEIAVKNIEEKIESPILNTNIRIVASGESLERAESILSDLESAFNQFSETKGNGIRFEKLEKAGLREMLHRFSYRTFSKGSNFPLSLKELTTMFHFPVSGTASPQLKEAKSGMAPAPINMPKEGIILGSNYYRHAETKIKFGLDDRMRHFYVVGQTGTGKTTLLKNMIMQDILAGEGVCMIDPHGSDLEDILSIIPESRMNDVIYFDPSYTARPMGLNMLEYDSRFPEQKTFVVDELFSIFQKLYGDVPESMGPMFEQYFRNATMLVIEDPETGSTLLDVSRVLSDAKFRELKLSRCNNPIVVQFWRDIAEKAGGEGALQNIVPYITSKFDVFLANEIMRPIVAQEHSAFNFRNIMDDRKILLVNLSKGRLGDINSSLIGLIVVGKILMAALSRIDAGYKPPEFYLYIDEFQNVTTDSIAVILSEARKYRLSLNVAHQFISQLDEKIRDSVFGNVGSIASFRVGAEDAEYLEKQFAPVFNTRDIMNLDNHNAYLKLLIDGQPAKPFNIVTEEFISGSPEKANKIKELSYQKYGKDRKEIEEEIISKYRN